MVDLLPNFHVRGEYSPVTYETIWAEDRLTDCVAVFAGNAD